MKYPKPSCQPDWFDIKNYEYLRGASRADLIDILKTKRLIYSLVIDPATNHLIDFNKAITYVEKFSKRKEDKSVYSPKYTALIEHLKTVDDLEAEIIDIPESILPDLHELTEEIALDRAGSCVLVNLDYKDTEIIQDFKEWLKEKRKSTKAVDGRLKNLPLSEVKKLEQGDIIACMDLLIWQKHKGKKLYTDEQIAAMIYPCEVADERIKKTTRKKAERYLNMPTSKILF